MIKNHATTPFNLTEASLKSIQVDSAGSRLNLLTRPATRADFPFLSLIFNHYITNTVISFRLEPVDVDFYEAAWTDATSRGLPFLISIIHDSRLPGANDGKAELTRGGVDEKVIGYAYALPYRPSYSAYRHTVEISVYIHHEHRHSGAGSALMNALMDALRHTRVPDPIQLPSDSVGVHAGAEENSDGTERIHQVLAIMSLDTEGNAGGLEKFYGRWGFERIGCMKKVGFKFGRWIDVLLLQASV